MKPALITEPGMYFDIEADVYHAEICPEPALTKSGIFVLVNKSPLHFALQHPAISRPALAVDQASKVMDIGTIVHKLTLGRGKNFTVVDADDWRGGEAKDARNHARSKGKVPILRHEFDLAEKQATVLRAHLSEILRGEPYLTEVVIVWQIETKSGRKIWARGMLDVWCPSLVRIVDVKATVDAAEKTVVSRMVDGGYDLADAWYRKGVEHILGIPGRTRFTTLFSEREAPFETFPADINEAWSTSAWDICEEAVELFAECLGKGKWPGYPREPQTLAPPDWLINQRLNRRYSLEIS